MNVTRRQLLAWLAGQVAVAPLVSAQEEPRFYITGFVKALGAYRYREGMTVLQAIAEAGGLTAEGSARGIVIKRRVDGEVMDVPSKVNDRVLPEDTIVIRRILP